MNPNINWDEVIDKKACGIDDYDLGEVQEVQENVVVTQKGILDKDKFYLTKRLVHRFDGLYCGLNNRNRSARVPKGLKYCINYGYVQSKLLLYNRYELKMGLKFFVTSLTKLRNH